MIDRLFRRIAAPERTRRWVELVETDSDLHTPIVSAPANTDIRLMAEP